MTIAPGAGGNVYVNIHVSGDKPPNIGIGSTMIFGAQLGSTQRSVAVAQDCPESIEVLTEQEADQCDRHYASCANAEANLQGVNFGQQQANITQQNVNPPDEDANNITPHDSDTDYEVLIETTNNNLPLPLHEDNSSEVQNHLQNCSKNDEKNHHSIPESDCSLSGNPSDLDNPSVQSSHPNSLRNQEINLGLTKANLQTLENEGEMLTDDHIVAAGKLISAELADESQTPAVAEACGYSPVKNESINIIHAGSSESGHWICTAIIGEEVIIADSGSADLSSYPSVSKKMFDLYSKFITDDNELQVRLLNCQKQNNGTDCGLFAVAFAFELCACGRIENIEGAIFDCSKMRRHLKDCFKNKVVKTFPQSVCKLAVTAPNYIVLHQ